MQFIADCTKVYCTLVPRTLHDYIICTGADISAAPPVRVVKSSINVTNWGGIPPLAGLGWPLLLEPPCSPSSHEASENLTLLSSAAAAFRATHSSLPSSLVHCSASQLIVEYVIWSHNCTQSNWKYPDLEQTQSSYPTACNSSKQILKADRRNAEMLLPRWPAAEQTLKLALFSIPSGRPAPNTCCLGILNGDLPMGSPSSTRIFPL